MNTTTPLRRLETLIYAGLWTVLIAFFALDSMRARSYTSQPLLTIDVVVAVCRRLVPFILIFAVNNYVLVPRFLLRNRLLAYLALSLALVGAVWALQYAAFADEMARHGVPGHGAHMRPGPRPLLPLPLFLDLVFDILILGLNLVIALIVQRLLDRLEHERLLKADAENQLAYLKAQINPHFYLNMLNNIHGMIELNPAVAQDMVIEMSRLMRYMLYDSSQPRIPLSAEVEFLKDYISLMQRRFPLSKVKICADFPAAEASAGVMVPPLLFLVFIENAFKHGISYHETSFITVHMQLAEGHVDFECLNSLHPSASAGEPGGIGLVNARKRLALLYHGEFSLETRATNNTYLTRLSIPTS